MDEVWFLNFQSFLSNGNDIVFDIWGFTSERINRRVVVGEMHRILRSPAVMALQIQVMVVEENCDGLAVEEENCNGLMVAVENCNELMEAAENCNGLTVEEEVSILCMEEVEVVRYKAVGEEGNNGEEVGVGNVVAVGMGMCKLVVVVNDAVEEVSCSSKVEAVSDAVAAVSCRGKLNSFFVIQFKVIRV